MGVPVASALEQLLMKLVAYNGVALQPRSYLNFTSGSGPVVDNPNFAVDGQVVGATDVPLGGGGGGGGTPPIRFDAGTSGGLSITQAPAGSRIAGVVLITINTPFSPTATLKLGSSTDTNLVFDVGTVDSLLGSPAGTVIPVFVDAAWPALAALVATVGGSPGAGDLSILASYVTSVQP